MLWFCLVFWFGGLCVVPRVGQDGLSVMSGSSGFTGELN